jgi:Transposase DNA-binding
MTSALTKTSFGEANFGQCDLGDKRRTARLVKAADQILAHPDKTLPHKFASPKDYRAVLRLANSPELTHAALLQAHAQPALDRLRQDTGPEVVVLPEDTTDLDFSGHNTLALGQIGNGHGRGFLCHNTLAVDPLSREILGLVDQILHLRRDVPDGELTAARRVHPDRESRLWVRAAANVGPAPAGKRWVRACDRGADSFEYLEFMVRKGLPFVFRSCQNRALEVEAGDDGPRLLHDRMRALPAQAGWRIELSAQKASKTEPAREARTAWVCAAAAWVRIKAPRVHNGEHGDEPVGTWAIRVWEPQPPAAAAAVEWLLLTDQEARRRGRLREVAGYYECRAVVEEFNKCQKTGAGIELLQLQSRAGLEVMIALLSVVAVALVNLRVAARRPDAAERPAEELVDPVWVQVLSIWRHGQVRQMTVREFTLALGRLGGHLNRKCDGLPGWLTLWRGWERLHTMLDFELSRRTCGKL